MQSLWMLVAAFVFSLMAVCVKLVSDTYSTPEIVMYRSLIGAVFLFCMVLVKGGSFKTKYPLQHLWRGTVGATAFGLWFFSMSQLPLATSITLNYMSPIWIAAILFGIGLFHGRLQFEWRLACAIIASFIGIYILLQPTLAEDQWLGALIAFISGILAALAYLQVKHLGNLGEPEYRVVFYFCVIGTIGGAIMAVIAGSYARRGRHSFSRTFSFKCFLSRFHRRVCRARPNGHDAGLPSGQYACHGQPPIFRHRFFLHMGIADMER